MIFDKLRNRVFGPPRCRHVFVDGFGGMGDAVTCCLCGLSKYPEALSPYSQLMMMRPGGLIKENHPDYRNYVNRANEAARLRETNDI